MNNKVGLGLIMVILAITLFGGSKGAGNNGLFSSGTSTPEQKQNDIQQQISTTQYKVNELQKQVQIEEDKKTKSEYNGIVDMQFISHSTDPAQEYIVIHINSSTKSIPVTGWKIKSLASGTSVTIPKGSYLYFSGVVNGEQDIYLTGNDTLYLVTGISPNGANFKVNKCSGYLNQFQTFTPYLGGYCPAPRNEDLSSIPRTGYNDTCFDYIDNMPSCRIQTDALPAGYGKWSSECTDFIYKKINYPSCVDAHKGDKDFYQPEWRVYLKRSETLWKNSREDVVLLDQYGKIVDEIKY